MTNVSVVKRFQSTINKVSADLQYSLAAVEIDHATSSNEDTSINVLGLTSSVRRNGKQVQEISARLAKLSTATPEIMMDLEIICLALQEKLKMIKRFIPEEQSN